MLYSIQQIKQVYESGEKPVLVECNDLNEYVCKHGRGNTPAYALFAEWICHSMLEKLNVAVAPKELVTVKSEHVIPSKDCQPAYFKNYPCFATLFLEGALEWSQFELKNTKQVVNKRDLVILAFCDIWFCNEDRNSNNFNLLTNPNDVGCHIVPIDHAACFNSLSFEPSRRLYLINEDDSLISTPEFRKLVKPVLKNLKAAFDFAESLYISIPDLEKAYDEQVLAIPPEWNIPANYVAALKENLFHKDWLNETKKQFLSFIKSSLNLK